MMKVNNLMMETCKFITILLLYCVCTAYCYPARPLNERSPELTWQAWMIVDDQNQNQNKQQTHSDGTLRRRITPKSVFIAPTFSPESLPPCADGYSSDPMGRCIKIIKLDQAAHREFIIEKLKERFGPIDYDDEEDTPTPGPFQINIPLTVDEDDSEEDTDVAIIVSPTKTFMENIGINLDKRDSIDEENQQEFFLKKLAATTTTTKKSEETTTVTEQSTTLDNEEASTLPEDLTSATEPVTIVDDDFATSTEMRSVKRSTTDSEEVATDSTEEYPGFTTTESTTASQRETTTPKKTPSGFRFPEEINRQSIIKFPESYTFQTQIPSSVEGSSNIHDTDTYLNEQAVYKISNEDPVNRRVTFRDQPHLEIANLDYSNGVQSQISSTTTHRGFNRRNRDKHGGMFLLPPRWSQSNFQKPLVLRFSRKHAYLDESQFSHPDFYRSVPTDDFAYLFKFKHKQSNHR